jgi:hypothetical protein
MTRPQVKELMQQKKAQREASKSPVEGKAKSKIMDNSAIPPSVDPAIDQRFFGVWKSAAEAAETIGDRDSLSLVYEPEILGTAKVRFYDNKREIDEIKQISLLGSPPDDFGRSDWDNAVQLDNWQKSLGFSPDHPDNVTVSYQSVPDGMNTKKELTSVEKEFSDWLYQNEAFNTYEHVKLKMYQKPGENQKQFFIRVQDAAKEARDDELDDIQERYEPKFERISDRIRREEQDLEEAQAESRSRQTAEIIGAAETIFNVFVRGRSRSISSVTSKSRMRRRAKQKLEAAKEELEDLHEDHGELEDQLKEKLAEVRSKWETVADGIEKHEVKPRRTDVKVDNVILTWHPYWVNSRGEQTSARK